MHHHARQRLPSHTHSLFQTHLGLGLASHGLTRRQGTARAAYATLSSAAMDDEVGREKEVPPRPKNPYPYPRHPNPTPYQIFHLPMSASQAQIKARYFELVRAHHPDSHHAAGLSAELAHARFRTIKASYDFLAGKTLSPHPNARPAPSPQNFDPYMHELARRRRAYYAAQGRYQTFNESGENTGYTRPQDPDDGFNESGRKERIILALGVLSLLAGLFPTMPGTLISALLSPSTSVSPSASTTTPQQPETTASPISPDSSSVPIPSGEMPSSAGATATSAGGMKLPLLDLNKGHRDAVSALVQVRSEREAMGVERREGVRRRVKEMNEAAEARDSVNNPSSPSQSARGVSEPTGPLRQGSSDSDVDEVTISELTPLRATHSSQDGIEEGGALALPRDTRLEPGGTDKTASSEA